MSINTRLKEIDSVAKPLLNNRQNRDHSHTTIGMSSPSSATAHHRVCSYTSDDEIDVITPHDAAEEHACNPFQTFVECRASSKVYIMTGISIVMILTITLGLCMLSVREMDTVVLTPNMRERMVTILTDTHGCCPDSCTFVHNLLPQWIHWRYATFSSEKELERHAASSGRATHVIVVANEASLHMTASWSRSYRNRTGFSVGLFHVGDLSNTDTASTYASYDYVLRHYYFSKLLNATNSMYVRALGNLTCGTGPPWPSYEERSIDAIAAEHFNENTTATIPRLGVHWLMLPVGLVRPEVRQFQRRKTTVWPVRYCAVFPHHDSSATPCSYYNQ